MTATNGQSCDGPEHPAWGVGGFLALIARSGTVSGLTAGGEQRTLVVRNPLRNDATREMTRRHRPITTLDWPHPRTHH